MKHWIISFPRLKYNFSSLVWCWSFKVLSLMLCFICSDLHLNNKIVVVLTKKQVRKMLVLLIYVYLTFIYNPTWIHVIFWKSMKKMWIFSRYSTIKSTSYILSAKETEKSDISSDKANLLWYVISSKWHK